MGNKTNEELLNEKKEMCFSCCRAYLMNYTKHDLCQVTVFGVKVKVCPDCYEDLTNDD